MNKKLSKIIASFLLFVFSCLNVAWADELTSPQTPAQAPLSASGVKTVIPKNTMINLEFDQKFNANKALVGDKVNFVLSKDLISNDGKVALPKGTVFVGVVEKQVKSKSFNRNARVYMPIKEVKLPSGEVKTISARVNKKKGELKSPALLNMPKLILEAGVVLGVGMVGFAMVTAYAIVGIFTGGVAAIALLPVVSAATAGLGVIVCTTSKGLNYKAKPGKPVQFMLQDDLELSLN